MTPLKPLVYFIGAGPGDPELLTLKAYKIITQADVILYADSLIPKQILQDVRKDAQLITTGNKTLESIIELIKNRVEHGYTVVRLHSGDLTLYSAIYEQITLLIKENIKFELVPGISAFQAAAAKISAELTIPELVQTIILTRVDGAASKVPSPEKLEKLAAHKSSLCLYLAARHAEKSQAALLKHYPSNTLVAICFRVGWPDEVIRIVPLENMAEVTQKEKLIRTTLYIISPALKTNIDNRSKLYHPDHNHLFRPERNKNI
ncbi:precorrin-4 C(11)-methyltransferase [Candidatus Atelocyanobacterium thalassae]|uniref:Cobalt-precorrin-4 C(11)-methyltransferase n=1 Tax=cyanobacterium endosymbiont of Braarudosphaera bigelowii TaxID=1285375 RepID=A0ABM7U3X7_9CHRO|nr:precorrin-4 C(11)-methyltransferase [Candidatus Atelocyanobacterium thalassa]BDA39403.1 cobalt-precorrin-4 C(11)-methyltransferase [cyanobacterium endosymbiont of Braarudosphaera bigelowii]